MTTTPIPSQNTAPPAQVPYFDEANPWRASQLPAQLVTGLIQTPTGQKAVLTIRQPGSTATVLIDKDDVAKWRDQIASLYGQMSGLIIPPQGG
jgi:hypothetical protein